jgi:hypothetical protein
MSYEVVIRVLLVISYPIAALGLVVGGALASRWLERGKAFRASASGGSEAQLAKGGE